jgi:hypothetical protein
LALFSISSLGDLNVSNAEVVVSQSSVLRVAGCIDFSDGTLSLDLENGPIPASLQTSLSVESTDCSLEFKEVKVINSPQASCLEQATVSRSESFLAFLHCLLNFFA